MAGRETRYATTSDGSQIAYQVVGDGPADLVYLTGRLSHVDMRWEHAASAHFIERLASFSRLIIFDRRGVGASDRLQGDSVPTWEDWAEDLEVVLDATNSASARILAVADGGAMALTFAAMHPERVNALVLFNALGSHPGGDDDPDGQLVDLVTSFTERYWGTEEWVASMVPSVAADPGQVAWFAKYMRATASPRAIAAQDRATGKTKINFLLPSIRVPTLVMNRTNRAVPSIESARELAALIPGARFLEIPGMDAPPQTEHADLILEVVEEFVTGVRPPRHIGRFLATVLFTDIVDSTRLASSFGDRAWRERLDAHDNMVRRELEHFRGREVKTTGDGFLATFDGPGRAIQCGRAIVEGAHGLGLEVRLGLHAGEVEARGDDIGGIAVHIGQRVSSIAGPGEILVSRTVTDLVAGSGIEFEDRGEHDLKGVSGTWRILAVRG